MKPSAKMVSYATTGSLPSNHISTQLPRYRPWRIPLWFFLVGVSAVMILWPVSPSPNDPLPVQSIHAIRSLPGFIVFFCGWAVLLVALLFSGKDSMLERLGLCLVFIVVFVEFWGLASPWGNSGDSTWRMAEVKYILEMGKIPSGGHPNLRYFDFPGLHLIDLALGYVTGTDLFLTTRAYLLASGLTFTVVLYAAFLRLMGSPLLASLAFILAVASSKVLGGVFNQFHPVNLATNYITLFFLLLTTGRLWKFQEGRSGILFLILALAAAVEYLFTPVFFSMVLLSCYFLYRTVKPPKYVSLSTASLPLVLFLFWFTYGTVWSFPVNVGALPKIMGEFLHFGWLLPTEQLLAANLGPRYPWWGNLATLFWWSSVFGLGTLSLLWQLRFFEKANGLRRMELAVFAGTLVTIAIGTVTTSGAVHGGFSRYVWVAPLFLVPAVIDILTRIKQRAISAAFVLVGVSLTLPTFLIHADTVSSSRTYLHELAAGQFIASSYSNDQGVTLFGLPSVPVFSLVNTPNARFKVAVDVYGATEAEVWSSLQRLVENFRRSSPQDSLAVVIPKGRAVFMERLAIPTDHPNWQSLEEQLYAANGIYQNGGIRLYAP
jgi:hypothetical protein